MSWGLFLTYVAKTKRCWIWQGNVDKRGYGHYGNLLAHRIAYELEHGAIPDGSLSYARAKRRTSNVVN